MVAGCQENESCSKIRIFGRGWMTELGVFHEETVTIVEP